jgi:hypothetical protein
VIKPPTKKKFDERYKKDWNIIEEKEEKLNE